MVTEVNRQRESAVKRHYGRTWSAPSTPPLLNTEWLGIEGAAQLIAHAARDKFGCVLPGIRAAFNSGYRLYANRM